MSDNKTPTNRIFTKSQWSRNYNKQKEVVAAMMQWIASAMLPFEVVDNDDFKHFMKVCTKGQYKPISLRIVSCTKLLKAAVDKTFNEGGISIMSDLWNN